MAYSGTLAAPMTSERPSPPVIALGDRRVGPAEPPYVIAEVSANHGGSLAAAKRIVELAAEAGADAVKLQTYTPDSMTLSIDKPPFVVGPGTLWEGRTLHDLYVEAQTPWEWHEPLFSLARTLGLDCLSTPFDTEAVDFLEQFDPPAHKIASFELVDLELIAHAAATGRPLIMSTGMATDDEIDDAVRTARSAGEGGVVLLRCNSAYPADPTEMDLATIPEMVERWDAPVGLSDHTLDDTAAIVATGLGACVFEKHLIAARSDGGPDAAFSLEPDELGGLIRRVHLAAAARGTIRFGPSTTERSSLAFRRSLFVVEDLAPGAVLTRENVRAIRPAGGLPPKRLPDVLGRQVRNAVDRGTPLTDDLLS